MADVLLVAATARELGGREGLVCGVGPVEAAVATANELAARSWDVVLHTGIAGGRDVAVGTIVIGSEAVYCDLEAAIELVDRVPADPMLVAAARDVLPDAPVLSIGTSAAVGGGDMQLAVEAMEGFGVLRAAAQAGVPAVEIRVISNEIGESDRSRWRVDEAIDVLSGATTALLERFAATAR